MGVVNVTPDSFSDGGLYLDAKPAVERGLELARQGADWIDVGGESTRPGSKPVPEDEELRRVIPAIRGLRRALDRTARGRASNQEFARPWRPQISIDTTKASVAEAAVRAGATVINDVSGLRFDPRLADIARRYRTALVLMHLRGRPETIQQGAFARSIWRSLSQGLTWSVRRALASGVHRAQLIIDPGAGFGKTRRQNFEIIGGLERLRRFRLPILVGTSRKSFVQAIVSGAGLKPSYTARDPGTGPFPRPHRTGGRAQGGGASYWAMWNREGAQGAVPTPLYLGDAAAVVASILGGAHIVRVHDPDMVLPAARVADAVLSSLSGME